MHMVKKVLLIFAALWVSLILFAPKQELYYLLEHQLQKEGIILSQERIQETALGLEIENAIVSVQGIEVGEVKRIRFWTLLLYSQVDLVGFESSPGIRKMADINLERAKLRHAVWHPLTLSLEAEGNFGVVDGEIDLSRRTLRLRWQKVGEISLFRPYLKKEKGAWVYERRF